MDVKTYSLELAGRTLAVEIGRWANQASGSAVVRYGDTTVLVTAVMSKNVKEGDFFPLTCDYEEKFYAAGKISGSRFIKREGRPSEEAVLSSRLIDRAVRPRFDGRMRNETQVVATVLSFDGENDPDVPAILGASVALSISDIPWEGPLAAVRVGRVNGSWILNPTCKERKTGDLDLIAAGLSEKINMLEAGAKELSEEEIAEALMLAHREIKRLVEFQGEIIRNHRRPKTAVALAEPTPELLLLMKKEIAGALEETMFSNLPKMEKHDKLDLLHEQWKVKAVEQFGAAVSMNTLEYIYEETLNEIVHRRAIEKGERPDGRKTDQLRPLSAEVGVLPRVHGSGVFQRGETQILSVVTLGAPSDEQLFDTMEGESKERFMHHYNHARFSTGEVGRMGAPGRREMGHGALAERALRAILPSTDTFPYTIRVVSETLTSNGSTSMASVSASSLALMDAGVPIKKPAGGIAMGLMLARQSAGGSLTRPSHQAIGQQPAYVILTDIQGPEDHYGDMDFKVAGTRDGVTALQLDVKIEGATVDIFREAMEGARKARLEILNVMTQTIPEARKEMAPSAPRIEILKINPDKIRDLIGPGGKIINEIINATGAQIDVEDDGTVYVTSPSQESGKEATEWIKRVTKEIVPGEILEGTVTRIFDFGAMVEVGPKQEGLVHISELAPWRVGQVTDIVNIGDTLQVKVKEIDSQGRINLSLKDVPGRYSEEDIAAARAMRPHTSDFAPRPRQGGAPSFRREDKGRGPRRY